MLELVGEREYPNVTIAAVLTRSGSNRTQFYTAFGGKEECFMVAYATAVDGMVAELLACWSDDAPWSNGMRKALERLAAFLADEPALSRGVFAGARVAQGRFADKREEALQRLTRAVDRARADIPASRTPPPPITARFIVGAIETGVVKFLVDPDDDDFGERLADFVYFSIDLYLGPKAAQAELAALEGR